MREARIKAELTQDELAAELGYKSAQFVSNWERGISTPPIANLRRLAEVLDVNFESMKNALKAYARAKADEKLERA
jgi:transcriptional regulator with XRE-family HTH domain